MASRPGLIARAAIESYSVLTRLPPPQRAHPSTAQATAAAGQILGGPAYDALIAFTAVEHQVTLLRLDQRATPTYEAVGATVEQLAP
jgi:hypothetical protein